MSSDISPVNPTSLPETQSTSPDNPSDASLGRLSKDDYVPADRRVLVVESEVEVADSLAAFMEELGHGVKIAADAKTALLQLHEFEPHLVLLGTYLADMPGYELSAILRGAPQYSYKFRHISLLFVADRHKLLKHRFVGAPDVPIAQYIFKPLDPVEIREKVTRSLKQSAA